MANIKIKKLLEIEDKTFHIGEDMSFEFKNNRYIVEIAEMNESDNSIIGTNIELNKKHYDGNKKFYIEDIKNCEYCYVD